jgi:hypothetical protein
MVNSSRADGLTGFKGMFVRPRVRRSVRSSALAALQRTKEKLEQPPTSGAPR